MIKYNVVLSLIVSTIVIGIGLISYSQFTFGRLQREAHHILTCRAPHSPDYMESMLLRIHRWENDHKWRCRIFPFIKYFVDVKTIIETWKKDLKKHTKNARY